MKNSMERSKQRIRGGEEFPLIHSQVRKIKEEEEEKVEDHSPPARLVETMPVFRELSRQLSRSPLGRAGVAISVVE